MLHTPLEKCTFLPVRFYKYYYFESSRSRQIKADAEQRGNVKNSSFLSLFFHLGVRFYRKRNLYPQLRDLNERREKIALDQNLRHGKEERPRRSDYVDW